jgi:hypothetical protein
MEQDNLKILMGTIDPLPEVDEEENDEMGEQALKQYTMLEVLNAIGEENFKEIYYTMINDIKQYPLEDQFAFCRAILARIMQVYNFEFPREIDLLTQESVQQIYILIEFIEFNNIDFLAELMKPYNFDFRKGDVRGFIETNYPRIEGDIERISRNIPEIISEFLRTYNKEDLIKWLVNRIEKSRMMVLLKMKEGELT